MSKYEITDAHFHLFPRRHGEVGFGCMNLTLGCTAEQVIAMLDKAGIERAFVFGLSDTHLISLSESNSYVLSEAKKFSNRLFPFGLLGSDATIWISRGIRGFKEHCYGQRRVWADPGKTKRASALQWSNEYKAIADARLPLFTHFGPDAVVRIKEMKQAAPRLRIVAAHLGWHFNGNARPDEAELRRIFRHLRDIDDLFYDISALRPGEEKLVSMAVAEVGSHRIMFGSDYPTDGTTPRIALEWVKSIGLNDDDLHNIISRTAMTLVA